MRETIGVGQLRSDLCAYLQKVAQGNELHVMRRGRVVALIEPFGDESSPRPRVISLRLSQFRSQAGRTLDQVTAGYSVILCQNGLPVARIQPRSVG